MHEVLDDPLGRKELGYGRNLLFLVGALPGHVLGLELADVVLVEPAQHLDLLPLLVRQALHEPGQEAVRAQQHVRQQQFQVLLYRREQERQLAMKTFADAEHQEAVQLLVPLPIQLQFQYFFFLKSWKVDTCRSLQNLRLTALRSRRQHPDALGRVAVHLHIT